jgi:hypothetical protein
MSEIACWQEGGAQCQSKAELNESILAIDGDPDSLIGIGG